MSNLVLPSIVALARWVKAGFVRQTHDPEAVQARFLFSLLRAQRDTELGRKYGLGDIRTIDAFRERVPILPYASYEPYLERVAAGEPNILTAEPVIYLTLTSGSTGKKKMIPKTRRSQAAVRQASLASMGFLIDGLARRGLSFGRVVVTNAIPPWGRTAGGIDYGPSSAGVLRLGRWLFERLFAHPYDTSRILDLDARHYIALRFALGDPQMRGFIANFPMLLLRTCHYLERFGEELARDIEKGTLAGWLEIDAELRSRLEKRCQPNGRRARQLQEILRSEGRLTPKLAWPELSFTASARGGTSDFYLQRFPEYFGNTPNFGVVFSSAEGMFSIYPDVNCDGSVLAIDSGFFEFIPQDRWQEAQPKTLLATEVKTGEFYRILNTTSAGFYRYDIGDVVEVVGFYERTPLVVFRHRFGGQISATTEKTTEAHATKVMQALQQKFDMKFEDFCILLSENDFPARYLLNVELATGDRLENPEKFLEQFDRELRETNTHYDISRNGDIPPPYLRLLAPGSFATVRQRQIEKGIPDYQLKFPHVSEDRQFLKELSVVREVRLPRL